MARTEQWLTMPTRQYRDTVGGCAMLFGLLRQYLPTSCVPHRQFVPIARGVSPSSG
jgi:hypothetical protein